MCECAIVRLRYCIGWAPYQFVFTSDMQYPLNYLIILINFRYVDVIHFRIIYIFGYVQILEYRQYHYHFLYIVHIT